MLFLLPWLPEYSLRKNDFEKFRKLWKHSGPEELEDYLRVFRNKSSLTAALNYYRANIGKGKNESIGKINTPTLFIWGNRDMAIGSFAAKGNHQYMTGEYRFLEINGGHWLIQSNYPEAEAAITEHLLKYRSTAQ